ncbi:hypothetical protein [Burkholderia gladioli]|uniref:Uncharacterized protein n=1 Tax=Burkholderia gladioli TaxID=28095 RepID=A0AB38U5T5_BURGA|nr:hypothetical protein [Burkholderia gladioli]UWX75359.1 hypothetical protein NYZ96_35340 [Burkholderia gladioli]
MTDEQNQQDAQPTAQEAGGASAGELSATSATAALSAEAVDIEAASQKPLTTPETDASSAASALPTSQALAEQSTNPVLPVGQETTDAPAVAEPGEGGSQPAMGRSDPIAGSATPKTAEQQESGVQATGTNEVPESGEDAASLAGSQSASDTSSSASPASPVAATLAEGASDAKSAIARLRDHLWTFEHSAVRHLHAELDKIEAWFK